MGIIIDFMITPSLIWLYVSSLMFYGCKLDPNMSLLIGAIFYWGIIITFMLIYILKELQRINR